MLGHISAPALDPSGLPATLSPAMMTYLRETGHFEGLIMTDAMDMGAVTRYYTPEQAAVKTIQAGADLVLLGANVSNATQIAAYRAVLDAVRAGDISGARLNDAVRHVLLAKQAHGLLTWSPQPPEEAESRIAAVNAPAVLEQTYAAALTVVRNEGGLLPLRPAQRVGIIAPSLYAADITAACKAQTDIAFDMLPVSFSPLVYERSQAVALAGRVDIVLVFTQDADQNLAQQNLVRALPAERTVVVALQSPFDLRTCPHVAGYVIAYDPVEPAFKAACGVLFGKQTSRGVLPVRLTDEYPSGWGLVIKP
jgi:beta-N-acetylhexosaminidase